MNKISVVIPFKDGVECELHECLSSIQRLNIASEIILVDSSTTTEAYKLVRDVKEQGIKVVNLPLHNKSFNSMTIARAIGIHAASGDYIMSMDSDDTIEGEFNREFAPINIATNNPGHTIPSSMWDYLNKPRPLQWGSVVRSDISRYLIRHHPTQLFRQEDISWGYRLSIVAWRDKLPMINSGLHYTWRDSIGRNSVTARMPMNDEDRWNMWMDNLELSIPLLDLHPDDAEKILFWGTMRRRINTPIVKCVQFDEKNEIDTHVLSYLEDAQSLESTLQSLRTEPTNVYVIIGGFQNSIGAARAFAFTQGSCEFVTFIDDDDKVSPGIYSRCLVELKNNRKHCGVYTDTAHFHQNSSSFNIEKKGDPWDPFRQLFYCPEITHFKLMRRSCVMPFLQTIAKFPTYEEYVLCGLITSYGPWLHIPVVGAYKKFKRPEDSSMRLVQSNLWKRAFSTVEPVLSRYINKRRSQ